MIFMLGFCQLFMVINMVVFGCASCNEGKKDGEEEKAGETDQEKKDGEGKEKVADTHCCGDYICGIRSSSTASAIVRAMREKVEVVVVGLVAVVVKTVSFGGGGGGGGYGDGGSWLKLYEHVFFFNIINVPITKKKESCTLNDSWKKKVLLTKN